jgi:hypothetical protein
MKKLYIIHVVLAGVLLVVGCSKDNTLAPEEDPLDVTDPSVQAEMVAQNVLSKSTWPVDQTAVMPSGRQHAEAPLHGRIRNFQRQVISGDIVHYSFRVPVGPGQHDVIGIHRVVKETRPFRPIKTDKAVFFQHGDLPVSGSSTCRV